MKKIFATLVLLSLCFAQDESEVGDYSKPERWIATGGDNSKSADIFLATPTGNISDDKPYASFEDAKASASQWQRGVENLFKNSTNIYHPVYRYSCISCSGGGMDGLATRDILAAFDYYWKNYNKGERPFILLGFSQGAYVLWNVLLQYIDKNPDIQKYHILTYALGSPGRGNWSIDRNNTIRNSYFSQSYNDINKVICFAPYHESDESIDRGLAATGGREQTPITNPISWTTDDDYYECGSGKCANNVSGAQIDYTKGVLIVNTTLSPNGSWGYHGRETSFFAGSITQNIIDRIAAWNEAYGDTGEPTPIPIPNPQSPIPNSQKYYTIKGEPLGMQKPTVPGVYIVKQGYSVKKMVVR